MIKIAVIDSGNAGLYVMDLWPAQISDENGDYDVFKIIDLFDETFGTRLNESEISWGEINSIQIV